MTPKKPNFLVIGSAKCGTTALASILDAHPGCCFSRPKEMNFFQSTYNYEENINYHKGWEWYQRAFAHYEQEPVVGEASPAYSDRLRSPETAARIHAFNPKMRIIYMVRNPLERQISAWRMHWSFGMTGHLNEFPEHEWAKKGFSEWMKMQGEAGQWSVCKYDWQLDAYRNFFDDKQLHTIFLENWISDQESQLAGTLDFLGLDMELLPSTIQERRNSAAARKVYSRWWNFTKEQPLANLIRSLVPQKAIAAIKKTLVRQIDPPLVCYADPIIEEFRTYVRTDSLLLMEKCHQDRSIWNLGESNIDSSLLIESRQ